LALFCCYQSGDGWLDGAVCEGARAYRFRWLLGHTLDFYFFNSGVIFGLLDEPNGKSLAEASFFCDFFPLWNSAVAFWGLCINGGKAHIKNFGLRMVSRLHFIGGLRQEGLKTIAFLVFDLLDAAHILLLGVCIWWGFVG